MTKQRRTYVWRQQWDRLALHDAECGGRIQFRFETTKQVSASTKRVLASSVSASALAAVGAELRSEVEGTVTRNIGHTREVSRAIDVDRCERLTTTVWQLLDSFTVHTHSSGLFHESHRTESRHEIAQLDMIDRVCRWPADHCCPGEQTDREGQSMWPLLFDNARPQLVYHLFGKLATDGSVVLDEVQGQYRPGDRIAVSAFRRTPDLMAALGIGESASALLLPAESARPTMESGAQGEPSIKIKVGRIVGAAAFALAAGTRVYVGGLRNRRRMAHRRTPVLAAFVLGYIIGSRVGSLSERLALPYDEPLLRGSELLQRADQGRLEAMGLDPQEREILELIATEGLSAAEIARRIRMSVGQVRGMVSRVKRRLMEDQENLSLLE